MLLIVLGVVLGLLAGGVVYVQATTYTPPPKIEMGKVVVAAANIPERTIIQAASVVVKDMPKDLIPLGAVADPKDAAGKMTTTQVFAGEVVLASKLADTKGEAGLAYAIPPGKVVITFPASDIIGTRAVRPGDTVDILVTMDLARVQAARPPAPGAPPPAAGAAAAPQQAQFITQKAMQNVKVLAIGAIPVPGKPGQAPAGAAGGTAAGPNLITFVVSHDEALLFKALKDLGETKIELVLRPAGDTQEYVTRAVTTKDLLDRYGFTVP